MEKVKSICHDYEDARIKVIQDEAAIREMTQQIQNAISDTERQIVGAMLDEYQLGYEKRKAILNAVEAAVHSISDPRARTTFRQFYLEHIPLKSMTDCQGRIIGKSRADYYKNIGLTEFAVNLEKTEYFRNYDS